MAKHIKVLLNFFQKIMGYGAKPHERKSEAKERRAF